MKKLLIVPLIVLSLLLFGCSSGEDTAEKLASRLEAPFEYGIQSGTYAFTYKKETSKATAEITSPESLAGLLLVRDENGVNASYDGIMVTLPSRAAKRIFVLDDIVDSVALSLKDGTFVRESRDGSTFFGTSSGIYAYSIEVNEKTGDIVSAKAENGTEIYEYIFLQ